MLSAPRQRGRVAWSHNPLDDDPAVATLPDADLPPISFDSGFLPFDAQASALNPASIAPVSAPMPLMPRSGHAVRSTLPPRPAQTVPAHATGLDRRPDPAILRRGWSDWLSAHPTGLSHARAAGSLRVREIDLLRALQGAGVDALMPDPARLLEAAPRWGRFIVEVDHPVACGWLAMASPKLAIEHGNVVFQDGVRQFVLRGSACAEVFLAQSIDATGLYIFDAAGAPIARLHWAGAPESADVRAAVRGLLAQVAPPNWSPELLTPSSDRMARPSWCTIERQLTTADQLARACRGINETLSEGVPLQMALEATHAIIACERTPVHKAAAHAAPVQGTRSCKLHLRPQALRHAAICIGPDNHPFIRLHANDGGCLRLQYAGDAYTPRDWIQTLIG